MTLVRAALIAALATTPAFAQAPRPQAPAGPPSCRTGGMAAVARYQSVEQLPDGRVTFRLCAPDATTVAVTSADIADVIPMGVGLPMTKDAMGLWSVTTEKAVPADNYRYDFAVNGVKVPDPNATRFSEERTGTNSTFETTGLAGDFQAWKQGVPHGAVSTIEYWSTTLNAKRRAHVYTPPGYMKDAKRYPVLYLVHGAGDSDDSWTSAGHAQYIVDNLLAAGKAVPMIIVMPFGHTPDRPGTNMLTNQDFGNDLLKDLIPYVDGNYRTVAQPTSRAMAGLSMGGAHTINFGLPHPDYFRYIGIFSMGLGLQNPADITGYETAHDAMLRQSAKQLKLVYYAVGKDDFLYKSIAPTRAMLDKYGIKHVYNESGGGHTWINWRRYLADFAPRLFR